LSSVQIENASFDVIYNSFVLEHIKNADVVMDNFVRWLRFGGLIIIRIPDPFSVQGFITKYSPHWFHVFYYKYILRDVHAGIPGYAPYPTYYHPLVSRKGIADFCSKNGLSLIYESADSYHIPGTGLTKFVIQLIKRVLNVLSLGKLSYKHTNLLFVLKKNNRK
jgi:ubiquinone/menaquinone biosynthesis C-methylase UbiE